jgi:hypothetical protein
MRPHFECLFLRVRPTIYLPVLSQGCFNEYFVVCCAPFGAWADQFVLGIFYARGHVLLFILVFFLVPAGAAQTKIPFFTESVPDRFLGLWP